MDPLASPSAAIASAGTQWTLLCLAALPRFARLPGMLLLPEWPQILPKQVLKPGVEDLLGVDLQFLEISAKILQFIDPSLERTSLVDILGALMGLEMQRRSSFGMQQDTIVCYTSCSDGRCTCMVLNTEHR